jgi:sugar phosphate isomerase/epimerase
VEIAAFAGGLARAAALGASVANVRILDDDAARSADNLGRLDEAARGHGIEVSVEFTGYGVPHILGWTLDVIRRAGCGKVSLDPLHIARTGVPIEAIRRLDPGMIGYVQLCDGPLKATREDYGREGAYDRLPPGAGEFPLLDLLEATPPGFPLALEVPQERLLGKGASAMERARLAVDGARRLLDQASPLTP